MKLLLPNPVLIQLATLEILGNWARFDGLPQTNEQRHGAQNVPERMQRGNLEPVTQKANDAERQACQGCSAVLPTHCEATAWPAPSSSYFFPHSL